MTIKYLDSKRISGLSTDTPTETTSNITWSTTGKVGYNISGTTISRTGSAGWSLSKIQSEDTFTVGEGTFRIEFSGNGASVNTTQLGFNKGTLGYHYGSGSPQNPCKFAIYMAGGDQLEAFVNGTKVYGSGGTRSASDKYRLEINNDGLVKYYLQAGGTGSWVKKHEVTGASGTYFIQANSHSASSEATVHSKTVTTIVKPTNVQDNSILVEKDTGRRYWFDLGIEPKGTSGSGGDWAETSFNNSTIVNNESASGNVVTRTSGSGWNSYIRSNEYISPSTGGGEIYFTQSANTNISVGLEKSPFNPAPSATYTGKDYSFHTTSSSNNMYEHTSDYAGTAWASATNEFRITMDSAGLVKYYWRSGSSGDWTLERTSTVTASGDYYFTVSHSGTAGAITSYIKGTPATWTRQLYFADNFSSYATQTSANSAWVPASDVAGRRVNIADDDLDLLNDSGTTNYAVAYDLGTDISESKWTLRFSADVTLSSGSNNWCYIGLFNSDQSAGGGDSQNFCAVAFQNDGANTKFWSLAGVGKNVNAGNASGYFSATANGTLTSTKYYIQLRRLTATSMDLKIYTDANYSTLHASLTMSGSDIALDDLRYIKFANNTTSGSGSITIVMDDVKFRNGLTSI